MAEPEKQPSPNREPSRYPPSIVSLHTDRAAKGMIFVSYCGFDHGMGEESPEETEMLKNGKSEVEKVTTAPLHPTNAIELSSEEKITSNHGRSPSPIIRPEKTPALLHRNEQTKTVGKLSKGLFASTKVWLSRRICSAVRTCRRALNWVSRRLFRE